MLFDDNTTNRFWSKVDKNGPLFKDTPCWLWTAAKGKAGYGLFSYGGRKSPHLVLTHRITYQLLVGPIPVGLELDHLCRNTICCSPQHLEAVTHRENMIRGNVHSNGREQAAKTHCPQGHPYDLFNTIYKKGSRYCRECHRLYMKRWHLRHPKSHKVA